MTDVDSDIVEDMNNNPLADETDDSCELQLIEIVPLDRTSVGDNKPGFIYPVVEVKPEDLQDVKQELADDYKPEYIYPVVEVKPEDLQDVKQEPADDYYAEYPWFTIQVRSASTCAILCVSPLPSIHQISTLTSVTYKMLYNRSLLGLLPIFSLSALLKLNFFLLYLNNNYLKYRTALSLQPTPLAILVLFSTNTLPSRIKALHFLSLATITSVNFAVSAHTLTSKQPAPLPPHSSL